MNDEFDEEFDAVFNTPIGFLGIKLNIKLNNGALVGLKFLPPEVPQLERVPPEAVIFCDAIRAFVDNPATNPDLAIRPAGTEHQKRVWRALQQIPAGRVLTYGELASKLGSGARAVGNACRQNPIPLLIPCHRMVSRSGLGGFAGEQSGHMIELKRQLLAREGFTFEEKIDAVLRTITLSKEAACNGIQRHK